MIIKSGSWGLTEGTDANMKLQITHEKRPRNDRRRDRREMQESTTVKNGPVPSVWIVLHGVTTVTHRLNPYTS